MTGRAALLALVLLPATAAAVDVTGCGQVLRPGEIGDLRGDLDCATHEAVRVQAGATLRLNGFTLRGNGVNVGVWP